MKQGDVLKKERENKGLSVEETAAKLGIPAEEYGEIEAGNSPAEQWGFRLAQIAIQLAVPTSRLLAESGKFADCKPGQAGMRIQTVRQEKAAYAEEVAKQKGMSLDDYKKVQDDRDGYPRHKSPEEIAAAMGISIDEYREVEAGTSPVEKYGPLFLGFAEAIEQPVFNLFYPCGLPFAELDDYP
jgi:transcriptional regulator with XRE-family HTH domain